MTLSSGKTEPCGCGLDRSYAALKVSDEIIFKALNVSEIAQIARAERRLRDFLFGKWNIRARQAANRAAAMAKAGQKASKISTAIDSIMSKWARDVRKVFLKEVERTYRQARIAGHKKAIGTTKKPLTFDTPSFTSELTGEPPPGSHEVPVVDPSRKKETITKAKAELLPSFDLVDEAAIQRLEEHQELWIGEHYGKNVSGAIRETTKETMAAGLGRAEAGKLMKTAIAAQLGIVTTPLGFSGTAAQYFEGLAANAMTLARVVGQVRSFASIGITKYTIRNPSDRRTCPVCNHMVGKVFTTEQGIEQVRREMKAKTSDGIRKAHPWFSPNQLKSISPTAGKVSGKDGVADSKSLSAAGTALPPFHFRCRCTVDIEQSVSSFTDLSPIPFPKV